TAQPFLAGAVGRGGVEQVDAQIFRKGEQCGQIFFARYFKPSRVFHAFVAPELHRPEAEAGDHDIRLSQLYFVHDALSHGAGAKGTGARPVQSPFAPDGLIPRCSSFSMTLSASS